MQTPQVQYRFTESLTEQQVIELHHLMQKQWWGGQRSLEDVQTMVKNSSLMIAMLDPSNDKLIGFCRVLTDFIFRATIYDVMIEPKLQGQGLGKQLVDKLCNHPKLSTVSFIYLACEPALAKFYASWGFQEYNGRAEWMIKIQREE